MTTATADTDFAIDEAITGIAKGILSSIRAANVTLLDDYEDAEELSGFNSASGGPACCTVRPRLTRAAARVTCWARLPKIADGFKLVHGARILRDRPSMDLYLYGPGIDDDDPMSLASVLCELGRDLALALHPAIREEVPADHLAVWRELAAKQTAVVYDFRVVFDPTGPYIVFLVDVEDGQ